MHLLLITQVLYLWDIRSTGNTFFIIPKIFSSFRDIFLLSLVSFTYGERAT